MIFVLSMFVLSQIIYNMVEFNYKMSNYHEKIILQNSLHSREILWVKKIVENLIDTSNDITYDNSIEELVFSKNGSQIFLRVVDCNRLELSISPKRYELLWQGNVSLMCNQSELTNSCQISYAEVENMNFAIGANNDE